MVCNEPLRPGQRLEPDCPGFSFNFELRVERSIRKEWATSLTLSLWHYSGHRTHLEL